MTRRGILVVALVVISMYMLVAFSPLRDAIGRHYPEIAALFSPPDFNFLASYESGAALGIRVGMTRPELVETLTREFGSRALLDPVCGTSSSARSSPDVSIEAPEAFALLERDTICLDLANRRVVVIVYLVEDEVSKIDIGKVTWGI